MEDSKSNTTANKQCPNSLGMEMKDSSAKLHDEVSKEYFREQKGNMKPNSKNKDSELSWEKAEHLFKKKSKFSVSELNEEAGACGSRSTDLSTYPPSHLREKSLLKGVTPKNFSQKDNLIKLKPSGRPSSKVTH